MTLSRFLAALGLAALTASASPAAAGTDEYGPTEFTPKIARAAERGLKWLAAKQLESGAWEADVGYKLQQDYQVRSPHSPHVGVTALAGMAFLAGGHLPGRGPYGDNLERAVHFLLTSVSDLGFANSNHTRMYSHAFATLFLAEVYGTLALPELRTKLQHTVDLIVASQNDRGSWRYEPFVAESDMSITVCQLMALRAARNVGIRVANSTIERAVAYVKASEVKPADMSRSMFASNYYFHEPGCFRYQVEDDERSSFALTAAGIVSLYHAGHYNVRELGRSLYVLRETRARVSHHFRGHFFYWYGHYYAVQAAFLTTGDQFPGYWEEYFGEVSRELLQAQKSDGSWPNPVGPGPTFGTAVACIVLQVPKRYLPILQR